MTNPKPDDLKRLFEQMTPSQAAEYMCKHRLYFATLGPDTCLMIPFDSIWYERTKLGGDVLGYKIPFFLKCDSQEVAKVRRWLISSECPSPILQEATNQYAKLD